MQAQPVDKRGAVQTRRQAPTLLEVPRRSSKSNRFHLDLIYVYIFDGHDHAINPIYILVQNKDPPTDMPSHTMKLLGGLVTLRDVTADDEEKHPRHGKTSSTKSKQPCKRCSTKSTTSGHRSRSGHASSLQQAQWQQAPALDES